MTISTDTPQRKRPVNLTSSEDVVASAMRFSGNLSAMVETLLIEFTQRQRQAAADHQQRAKV